ncbi:MAG: hypothetical protein FJW26_04445 [Acidimicrobiia bacterium]|nr:hypothetical protein [Acidimicrobiia bacterium]
MTWLCEDRQSLQGQRPTGLRITNGRVMHPGLVLAVFLDQGCHRGFLPGTLGVRTLLEDFANHLILES